MTTATAAHRHRTTMRIPRSRGAFCGVSLAVLGIWAAIVPFVGPTFNYAYTPADSWHWTWWRFWLEVLPGAAAMVGGLLLMVSADRIRGNIGGWLAAASGAWLVVGLSFASMVGIDNVGVPASASSSTRTWETVGMFTGLGALILGLAVFALGRLAVVGIRDIEAADRDAARRDAERAQAERDRRDAARPGSVDVAAAERQRDGVPPRNADGAADRTEPAASTPRVHTREGDRAVG